MREKPIDRSTDSLLRLGAVKRRTGLSTATIYRKMASGEFPQTIRLSVNVVAWYETDINRWVAAPLEWKTAA